MVESPGTTMDIVWLQEDLYSPILSLLQSYGLILHYIIFFKEKLCNRLHYSVLFTHRHLTGSANRSFHH